MTSAPISDPKLGRGAAAKLPHFARSAALELLPFVTVLMGALAALRVALESAWAGILFENGDSLVLPLLAESLEKGDPTRWVSSSQLFIFPEMPLFFVSSLLAETVRGTLTMNAVVNICVIYIGFRFISHLLNRSTSSRIVEVAFSALGTLTFLLLVVLEPTALVNYSGLATPLLATTYYFGVIASGLFVLAATLWLLQPRNTAQRSRGRRGIYLLVVVALGALTTFSNPLYAVQVIAPLLAALVVMLFANKVRLSEALLIALGNLGALIAGMLLRSIFSELSPVSLEGYVRLDLIPTSLFVLSRAFSEMLSSPTGLIRLCILTALPLTSLIVVLVVVYSGFRHSLPERFSSNQFLVMLFISISFLSLVVGHIATGAITTRYLEPVTVFPLMAILALGPPAIRWLGHRAKSQTIRAKFDAVVTAVAASVAAIVVVTGLVSAPAVARAVDVESYPDAACLDDFVGDSTLNGVGSFWVTRPLQLYADGSGEVLQVDSQLAPFDWMINLGSYEDKDFSYVVVDQSGMVPLESLTALGPPNQVIDCSSYQIYDYRGAPGAERLTATVRDGLDRILDQQ